MRNSYQRTSGQLHSLATKFWPQELSKREAKTSVIPILLQSQDQFIAILSVPVAGIEKLFQVLESSTFSANLFLKHLMVLSDFGGEMFQRVNGEFDDLFPERQLIYLWNGEERVYQFRQLPVPGKLNNGRLGVSAKNFLRPQSFSPLFYDAVALLILGSAATDSHTANVLAKCEIGHYLGDPEKLELFVRQRYIWVSRITGGSQANSLGQIAQKFVQDYLISHLNIPGLGVAVNSHLPGVTHTTTGDQRLTTFDLVVAYERKYVAVEISFQVTTNSTIERKAGQARSRFEQIEEAGYKIAYIIDGAGNFQRQSAIGTICNYSHCTVAFSHQELDVLCQFIRDYFEQ